MKLKTVEHDGNTYAEIKDGKPIYVDDGGKETTYDPVAMHTSIGRLNKEAQTNREAKEALEVTAKAFEGLDPKAALAALETVKNLDDKKLIDTGEVERVKKDMADSYQVKLDAAEAANATLRSQYSSEKVNLAFASSEYIKEKLAIPADMAQAAFGKHFVFKDGSLTPTDTNGNPIYSDSNPGDVATFDEAIEKIVKLYPSRDSILKGSGQSGSGTETPGQSGGRTITRKQFEGMAPLDQQKFATDSNVQITD